MKLYFLQKFESTPVHNVVYLLLLFIYIRQSIAVCNFKTLIEWAINIIFIFLFADVLIIRLS